MINRNIGFILSLASWGFIWQGVFLGEAGHVAAMSDKMSIERQSFFDGMRCIATAGWCIHPLGYLLGYLLGKVNDDILNLIYEETDLVNKTAVYPDVWQYPSLDTAEKDNACDCKEEFTWALLDFEAKTSEPEEDRKKTY